MEQTTGYIVLGGMSLVLLAVAYFAYREHSSGTVDSLVTAGRRVGIGLIAASVTASWIWTTTIMGASEAGMTFGVSGGFHYAWGAVVPFLIFLPLALRLRRQMPQITTVGEFIQGRYGNLVHGVFLLFCAGVAFYVYTQQLIGAGIAFRASFGVPYEVTVLVAATLVSTYIALGGLRGSLLTDLIQFVVVAIASLYILPMTLVKLGGPSELFSRLVAATTTPSSATYAPEALNFFSTAGFRYGLAAVVIATGQVLLDQGYYQRAIAAASNRVVARGYLIGGMLAWFPIPLCYGLIMGSGGLANELTAGDQLVSSSDVAPYLVQDLLGPTGAIMFVIMTFMAATSTADTSLGGIQALFSVDVLRRLGLEKSCTDAQKLKAARVATVVVGALGAAVALPAGNVSLLVYDIFSGILFAAPVAALIVGVFSKKVPGSVALVSIGMGLSLGLGFWFFVDDTDVNWFYGNMASIAAPFLVILAWWFWSKLTGSGGDRSASLV